MSRAISSTHPGNPRSTARIESLDAFRGLAIAGMILVNNPGTWSHTYAPLRHAVWHGVTPTDLIFPFFLFAVGVSLPFSLESRRRKGGATKELLVHVAWRSLTIYALGLFLTLFPFFQFPTVRLVGVLIRIAFVYAMAGTLVVLFRRSRVAMVGVALLLGYWALMTLVPVPGYGAGDLSAEGNLAAYLDRMILGVHMWTGGQGVYDPEGLLSTLPALATTLMGLFAGDLLRSSATGRRKALILLGAGLACLMIGTMWGWVFPLNKRLWTSSYTVYTGGWALVSLAAFYWTMDVRGWRRWARPLVIYGLNAIAVYVASGLLVKTLIYWRVDSPSGEGTTSMYNWLFETLFLPWAEPINASLFFAVAMMLLGLLGTYELYRRKIFLKV